MDRGHKTTESKSFRLQFIFVKFIVQSDSRPDILLEIQQTFYRIQIMGLTVIFVWVLAHCGIPGNEMADKIAKEATKRKNYLAVSVSKTEFKSILKQRMKENWQKQWEGEMTRCWFYKIQRKMGTRSSTGRNRIEETIISRMRFGHTGLNTTLFKINKHRCVITVDRRRH